MKSIIIFKQASEEYRYQFSENGFNCIFIEPLQFSFINLSILEEKLKSCKFEALILTSPRAVEALCKVWSPEIINHWTTRSVYTVGETSASKIKIELGIDSKGSQAGNAGNLADIIIAEDDKTKTYLFPCGNLKTETIIQKLRENNFNIEPLTVYETIENTNLRNDLEKYLNSKEHISALVFFSPSGVRFVTECVKNIGFDISSVPKFAIGRTTSSQMSDLGLKVDGVAEQPNLDSLLKVVNKNLETTSSS